MLLQIFNHKILLEERPNLDIFHPHINDFKFQLDNLVQQPNFRNYITSEQTGDARTTVNEPYRSVRTLGGFYFLMSCLHPYFMEAKEQILGNSDNYLRFGRAWVNYMFKGCAGTAHTHNKKEADLVGIFYMAAPPGSGDLVILDSEVVGIEEKQFDISKKFNIKPKQYSLCIHDSSVNHAITEHQSVEDRICIVIEAKVNKLSKK